jgi:hypothetical protein
METLYVAQQLHGSPSASWVNYTSNLHDGHQVPWDEFGQAFRGHHITVGLMGHKLQEFMYLQQGPGSAYEYIKRFSHLSQCHTPF